MKRLVWLLCLLGITSARDAQREFELVIARYRKVKTVKGDFVERICSEELGYCQSFEGGFYFARPDKFRFEVTDPVSQLTVGDSEELWIYEPDSARARKSPSIVNPFFAILLNSSSDVFAAESLGTEDEQTLLTLVPTDSLSSLSRIRLLLNPQDHSINDIQLDDGLGTVTRYTLSGVGYNPRLPDKLFRFVPPPGTTIVE